VVQKKAKSSVPVKRFALGLGVDLFGVADIRAIKREFVLSPKLADTFDNAIVLGVRLSVSVLQEIEDHPTKLYFHHYRTLNAFLDQAALRLTNFIQDRGYEALAIPASQILNWENQTSHLSHKKIGVLAGLGWIGRNNLLVNKRLGSQFRLVTILTSMPLEAGKPTKDSCAPCKRCLAVCPAGAIKEKPEDFDHQKCFALLQEFQKKKLVDQYVCGICVKACHPANVGFSNLRKEK
jgi:epoxyqueuosine reductase QueG